MYIKNLELLSLTELNRTESNRIKYGFDVFWDSR